MFARFILIASIALSASAQNAALDHFEKKIRPVLASRCYACHSANAPMLQGGLKLDSPAAIQQGGNSGALINTADPERSLLLRALRHTDQNLKMPPGKPLAPEVVADFEQWIREGAALPANPVVASSAKQSPPLWSLQKPVAVKPPAVRNESWVRSDIDRFILSRLEEKNLTPSPEADKRTLIRRAYYDLTGLPPSADEIAAFVKDASPNAYEQLVDRLLASPRYGERWGRHWLDVARYADAANDSVNQAQRFSWSYTYRDWVIRALNEDLPYNRFLTFQIAADRVPNLEPRHLAALGFVSLGREFPKSFPETVDDRIDAVARGMLGFTVACARCHDHKYDPIPTKDYYSLYSVFSNIREPEELPLLNAKFTPTAKDSSYQQRLEKIREADHSYRMRRNGEMVAFFKTQTAEYLLAAHDAERLSNTDVEELVRDRQLNQHVLSRWRDAMAKSKASGEPVFRLWHEAAAAGKWTPKLATSSEGNPLILAELRKASPSTLKDVAAAYATVLQRHDQAEPYPTAVDEELRGMMRGPNSPADVPLKEFELIYSEGDGNNTYAIKNRFNALRSLYAYDGAPPRAMAVEDVPNPKPGHVFVRGNPANPGAETPPHFLTCIAGPDAKIFQNGSGRLDLAKAIVDPENPLTARVIVNRVWMYHFGAGIVRTPSDFGRRGDPPTHPELLDTLAVKFVESGWSLKKLHRAIMLSAAYRQSSGDNEAGRKLDPENLLLWRMNRQRLDIESLRDSMLAASGTLDLRAGGVPFALTAQPSVPRRSVYGFIERGRIPGVLSAFDFASPDQHAPMRFVTTVPQQALFFLNSPFVTEQAAHLAKRSDAASEEARIGKLYRFVFGRSPEPNEIAAGVKFINAAEKESPAEPSEKAWQYGTAKFDTATGKVASFTPFSTFVNETWQGAAALPTAGSGKAFLRATGGEPGEQSQQAVVRRWASPESGTIAIEGTLRHGQAAVAFGDGVRGRIVSSRHGELASWSVNGSSAETKLNGIKVEKGETIDFIVDAKSDPDNDAFQWTPIVKLGQTTWNAKNDFGGPSPKPLDIWARYAQVLLETNEFAFVD